MLVDAHLMKIGKGKNQYPLKSIILALNRENILADIYYIRNGLRKFVCTQNPAEAGLVFVLMLR